MPSYANEFNAVGATSLLTSRDRQSAIERARERAEKRIEEREHLRLELKAREYIHTVHGIIDCLVEGQEDLRMQGGQVERVPLTRQRVQALKTAMDGSLRLLDRVLPPLKAVEVQKAPEDRGLSMEQLSTHDLLKIALARQERVIEPEEDVPHGTEAPPWE